MDSALEIGISPEEEKLWMMSDEELEKASFEEKNKQEEEEDDEIEDETDVTEQTDDLEDETDDNSDEDAESDNETDNDEVSDSIDDEVDNKDSEDSNEKLDEEEKSNKSIKSEITEDSLKPVRANGMDIPVKSIDEVYQLASMGANYKKKMQDIAPFRRSVSAMKEHNLTDEDIALLIDIKKGDKDALAKVVKDSKIDAIDLDTEDVKYESKLYGDDEATSNLKDIEETISKDPEYKTTVNVVNNLWDSKSQEKLANNPDLIERLHYDVKNGIYEKVAPEATRLEFLDQGRKSKLEYYVDAGRLIAQEEQAKAEAEKKTKVANDKKVAKKRKAAATTKSKATKQKTEEPDFVNMSDDEYDKFYKEVMMS
jgi:hypothetical protein